jgi:penicillin-binding protein 1A
VVLNKLMQRVVTSGWGTGGSANLGSVMPTAGKTGTSEWDVDQWFIGMTPYYVCQVWLGYDTQQELVVDPNTGTRTKLVRNTIRYNNYGPPILWKTIMEPISEKQEAKPFLESDEVVSHTFCQITGNLATNSCPSVGTGWYKKSRIPPTCNGNHAIVASAGEGSGEEEGSRPYIPAGTPEPILPELD